MTDGDGYPKSPRPPWAVPEHDVMADMMRMALALGAIKPTADVRTDSDETFLHYVRDFGVKKVDPPHPVTDPEASRMLLGSTPVVVDSNMVPGTIAIIGETSTYLIRKNDGSWIQLTPPKRGWLR